LETNNYIDKLFGNNIVGNITILDFFLNLLFTLFLSLLVGFIYSKFGRSLSNRKEFASNFCLLSMTTMLIISIVKSSLALSLGLVGALSIVRFRTAIKEPEELIYLFISIAIGLGLGANQVLTTFLATIFICLFIYFRFKLTASESNQFFNLLITIPNAQKNNFDSIIKIVSKYSDSLNIRRYTEEKKRIETCLQCNISSYEEMRILQKEIVSECPDISIDFIDNSDI
tara:strand:+ start:546 stop:1229 length:684 start_codon:yes stop_codon:yes gene_type:complete